MKAHFSHVHWGWVLLTDVLLIILVLILSTIAGLLVRSVWGSTVFSYQVLSWSTSLLTILLTAVFALWVAHKEAREAPVHGFLVGLIAALILSIFSPDVTNFFTGAFRGELVLLVRALGTFLLMVVAGWLMGVLVSRGREKF